MNIGKTALIALLMAVMPVSFASAESVDRAAETLETAEETTDTFYIPPYLNPEPIDALKPYLEANDDGEPKSQAAEAPAPKKESLATKLLWGVGGIIAGFILFAFLGKTPGNAGPKHPRFPRPEEPPENKTNPEDLDKYIEHANLYTRLILNTFITEADALRSIQGRSPESEFLRLSILSRLSEHAETLAKINRRLCFFDSLRCGTFQLKKINVDINTVMGKCAKAFRQDADISLSPHETPLYAQIDYARFLEAITALLENAVKYGKNGDAAAVSISAKPFENGRILIMISDKGPGMEKIVASSMLCTFAEFQKSFTDKSGAGLGIRFAKTVFGLNGGELWFISKLGEGLSACISIPAVTAAKENDTL